MTIFSEVASSTVTLLEKDGSHRAQGVYIGSNMILTAWHCLQVRIPGDMAQGDVYFSRIKFHEESFLVFPIVVEPCCDIVVLSAQENDYVELERFEKRFEYVRPIVISRIEPIEEVVAYVLTHDQGWLKGKAKADFFGKSIRIKTEKYINNGTSGGPIINESGELIGVVSRSDNPNPSAQACEFPSVAVGPFPFLSLPAWIIRILVTEKQSVTTNLES